jgi:hypothetical protein
VILPLYLLGLLVIAADLWGVVFWARVGGNIGIAAAIAGVVVAVVLVVVMVVSLRRLWLSRRAEDGT